MASQPWESITLTSGSEQDPETGCDDDYVEDPQDVLPMTAASAWRQGDAPVVLDDTAIHAPLEEMFGQVRSRARVRDLAEVFTHQREVDAILDLMPDAFTDLDVKFLEPSSGSGNFLSEILRRKLRLVTKSRCASQARYEHSLLRAVGSIYGVDISNENVTEARGRMAHLLIEHYQRDANRVSPTPGFLHAATLMLGSNIVAGDTLNAPESVGLCDWRPGSRERFQRVWSFALVPLSERDLFWAERIQDPEPVHYTELASTPSPTTTKVGVAR